MDKGFRAEEMKSRELKNRPGRFETLEAEFVPSHLKMPNGKELSLQGFEATPSELLEGFLKLKQQDEASRLLVTAILETYYYMADEVLLNVERYCDYPIIMDIYSDKELVKIWIEKNPAFSEDEKAVLSDIHFEHIAFGIRERYQISCTRMGVVRDLDVKEEEYVPIPDWFK